MNTLINLLRQPGDEVFSSRQKFLIADTIERLEKENETLNASVYGLYELEKQRDELRMNLDLFVYAMENCPDTEVYQSKEAYTHWITNFLLEPFSASKKLLRV